MTKTSNIVLLNTEQEQKKIK